MSKNGLSLRKRGKAAQVSPPDSRLFTLPAEIRIAIYTLLLVSRDALCPNVMAIFNDVQSREQSEISFLSLPHERTLAIARTCTRVRDEVLPIYFGSNNFVFKSTWDMYAYLHMIGDCRKFIQNISFAYQGSQRNEAFELLSKCTSLSWLDVMVMDETMKGARNPQNNLFAANGMRTLRAIRGLVKCKVTVREVEAIWSADWRNPKLLFNLNTSDKRRFDNENIREVERVLTLEISEREDDALVRLKEARDERKAKKEREFETWRVKNDSDWKEFTRKRAMRLKDAKQEGLPGPGDFMAYEPPLPSDILVDTPPQIGLRLSPDVRIFSKRKRQLSHPVRTTLPAASQEDAEVQAALLFRPSAVRAIITSATPMFSYDAAQRVVICRACGSCVVPGRSNQERLLRAAPPTSNGHPNRNSAAAGQLRPAERRGA
ncbi:hypothetical protein GMDG_07859 [Pseudogymnoascus destructans 20631-21]|uniref:F-box domain-containing protein n=1 Tax=Pseudogymnoascus destructans (strain ATCC MYA-4855 / 20631-21) TaxID=658429 RepID=L8G0B1_PSED2|nr:hypothetical protein GMDG_07859 [Pseudogymnoascus destructans 20631-21]